MLSSSIGRHHRLLKRCCFITALTVLLLLFSHETRAQTETLRLETWRVEDEARWHQQILPIFHRTHPSIKITTRTSLATDYDSTLLLRLAAGTAGDLITCRPFDQSLALYNKGYLQDITAMPELRKFRSYGKIAWTTYYADRVFCMPVAAVMTGFFFNTQIFKELNLTPPHTEEELFDALAIIKRSGKYLPLAFGTKEAWQSSQILFAGMGPNHWHGEQGRINLLTGRAKFTDAAYVDAWRALAKISAYLPENHKNIGEREARELFLNGQAAIYPAGSWEIPFLSASNRSAHFAVFAPPPKHSEHNCHVLSHLDLGIGINAKSTHPEQAATFLAWLSGGSFAQTLSNSLPGFFPLSNHSVEINNPLAKEMMSWRQQCDTSIRINSQFLNQAWPSLEQELWRVSAQVMRQEITPEEAAKHIADGVDKWFKPI